MQANARLTERRVQDLNEAPALPFADETFDAVSGWGIVDLILVGDRARVSVRV